MVIWITGISGTGKTTLAQNLFKTLKKKYKSTIYFDGDQFRSVFKNDIGYTLKDRDKNAVRLTRLVKFLSEQKINIIISANITSMQFRKWCRKNIKNYYEILIEANISNLIERDYKNIYKNALKKKIKNVVGVDIPYRRPRGANLYITNNGSKKDFLKHSKLIHSQLKNKKSLIFY
tara:strand:+ start:665 stop:1192 length:528 start_codon:yes stop_codon:yes gene_type:complete